MGLYDDTASIRRTLKRRVVGLFVVKHGFPAVVVLGVGWWWWWFTEW